MPGRQDVNVPLEDIVKSANDVGKILSGLAEGDPTRAPEYNDLVGDLYQAVGVIKDMLSAVRSLQTN